MHSHQDSSKLVWRSALLVLAVTLFAVANSFAQDARQVLGTSSARGATKIEVPIINAVSPIFTFSNADYGTGGTALRNRAGGAIHVSGVVGPVQAAYLYWAFLKGTTVPAGANKMTITRLLPAGAPLPSSATVTGTLLATGADPCWGSGGILVYRASVPLTVATGNGMYKVAIKPTAVGLTTGGNPWATGAVFPAWEGASLVIVGSGSGTVSVYDVGFTGTTLVTPGSFTYTLNLPVAASGSLTLWDNIGADGQTLGGRTANPSVSGETTSINGVAIAGPGGLDNDSDWNGNSGFPLPQLWDDSGHDITGATPAATTSLNVTFTVFGDCVTTVANVVEVH